MSAAVPAGDVPLLTRIARTYRDQGARGVAEKTLWDLGLYRRCEMHWNTIEGPEGRWRAHMDVDCDVLAPEAVEEYVRFRPEQDAAVIRARLEFGHVCVVARREGRIVGATWAGVGRMRLDYLGCEIVLAADAQLGYDNFVLPEFRGLRVMNALLYRRYTCMTPRHPRAFGIVWPQNRAAVRRRARREATVFGVAGYVGPAGVRRYFLRLDPRHCEPSNPPLALASAGMRAEGSPVAT